MRILAAALAVLSFAAPAGAADKLNLEDAVDKLVAILEPDTPPIGTRVQNEAAESAAIASLSKDLKGASFTARLPIADISRNADIDGGRSYWVEMTRPDELSKHSVTCLARMSFPLGNAAAKVSPGDLLVLKGTPSILAVTPNDRTPNGSVGVVFVQSKSTGKWFGVVLRGYKFSTENAKPAKP